MKNLVPGLAVGLLSVGILCSGTAAFAAEPFGSRDMDAPVDIETAYRLPGIYATKLTIQQSGQHVTGSFVMWNNEDDAFGGLQYNIEVRAADDSLLDVTPVRTAISLKGHEQRTLSFSSVLPALEAGTYTLRIQVVTNNGRSLGWADQTVEIRASTAVFAFLTPVTLALPEFPGQMFHPLDGPNVSATSMFALKAVVENKGTMTATFTPNLDIYEFDIARGNAVTTSGEAITLKAGERKEISIPVTAPKSAGVFSALLTMKDLEGDKVSSVAEYRFVVRGASADILPMAVSHLATKQGDQTLIRLDAVGSPDAETKVQGILSVELSDEQGVLALTSSDFTTLSDALTATKVRLTLTRDAVGPQTIRTTITDSDGTVLSQNSMRFDEPEITAEVAASTSTRNSFPVALPLVFLLVAAILAAVGVAKNKKLFTGTDLIAIVSVLLFCVLAGPTWAAGNGNGIEILTPAYITAHAQPGVSLTEIFINAPIHDAPAGTYQKNAVPLQYRVTYFVCQNRVTTVRVIGRIDLNGGKQTTLEGTNANWQVVHSQQYARVCDATSIPTGIGTVFGAGMCYNNDQFSGTIDMSAVNPAMCATTLQVVAKAGVSSSGTPEDIALLTAMGAMTPTDDSVERTDPNISHGFAHGVNIWVNFSCPTFTVAKTADVQSVSPGGIITYTVGYQNNGSQSQQNVRIVDRTPAGTVFVTAGSTPGCTANGSGVIECSPQFFSPGQSASVTLKFQVLPTTSCSTVIDNVADLQQNNTIFASSNHVLTSVQCQTVIAGAKTGPATVMPGGDAVYQITLTNTGNTDAMSPVLTDVVDMSLIFDPAVSTPGCVPGGTVDYQGQTRRMIDCTGFTLAAGQSRTFTFGFHVPSTAVCNSTLQDHGAFRATNFSPGTWTNFVTTTVTCTSDLSITKTGPSPNTVQAGQTIVYTVTASNAGPGVATNVVIADVIPAGLTFNQAQSSNGCVLNGAQTSVLCNNFDLAAGASRTFQIAFDVPFSPTCSPSTIQNIASVSTSSTDPNPANNQSQTVITPVTCSVTLLTGVKTGPATVAPGGNAVYQITLTNTGNNDAITPVLTDVVDMSLVFDPAGTTAGCVPGGTVDYQGRPWRTINCTGFTLARGQSRIFTFAFQVPPTAACNSTFEDHGAFSAANVIPGDWTNTVTTTVTCPVPLTADLSITKTGPNPNTVQAGQTIVYTVTASNAGPGTATNVVIADVIPAGLSFNSSLSSTGCALNGAQTSVLCNNFDLAAGASRTFQIAFNVPLPQVCSPSSLQNTASVSASSTDPNTANNQSQTVITPVTCPVSPNADLAIVKTGPATVAQGAVLTYNISVTNNGPSTTPANVTVTDPIPTGSALVFNPSASTQGCAQTGTNIVCTATVNNGASANFVIAFTVQTTSTCTAGNVTNTATVASQLTDPVMTNNTSATVTTSITCPNSTNLTIYKTDNRTTASPGETLNYTILLTNNGTVAASNVTVYDTVPSGLTILSVSDGGTISGQSVTWNSLTIAAGSTRTLTLNAQIRSDLTNGTQLRNTATVNGQSSSDDTTVTVAQTPVPPYYPPYTPPPSYPQPPTYYPPVQPPIYYPPVAQQSPVFTPPVYAQPPVYNQPYILPLTGTDDADFYSDPHEMTTMNRAHTVQSPADPLGGFSAAVTATLVTMFGMGSAIISRFLGTGL